MSNWNVSPKNHVLAQRITPAELAGHRNELHHIWTQPGRTRHQPISSVLNVKFQIHSSTNSATERVKLLDDLNVTLRFITKL